MNQGEFARRRRALMRMIGKESVAILPAASTRMRNRDVEYPFRQDSDFYYLTGFNEPDAVLVLAPGRAEGDYILFCRERDPKRAIWDGERAGPEGAIADFAADDAYPVADLDGILPDIVESRESVYYTMGQHPEFDTRLLGWVGELRQRGGSSHTPDEFIALDHLLHDLRMYKSRAEVSAMRKAARIGVAAHRRAIAACRPGMYEYELEAEYLHEFRRNGVEMSYQPIVGGGANGCILHYIQNDQMLRDGDLVLADVGCEFECYASDITRTWPVNGSFTDAQRELYEIVLEAHDAAVQKVGPGQHWNEPHDAAVSVITRGLRELGLLKGALRTLIKDGKYRKFFMHRTGHWLGLDVHDVGDYKVSDHWRLLEPGMVMTVEPGIYVPDQRNIPKRYRNTGIRIEDDVLVTPKGNEVMTSALPVDPDEIEAIVGSAAGQPE
jgi:Xaa-Pro aminopeptidase